MLDRFLKEAMRVQMQTDTNPCSILDPMLANRRASKHGAREYS
jgi:hypothetical protein